MDQLQWRGINKNLEEKRNVLGDLFRIRYNLVHKVQKRPCKVVKTKKQFERIYRIHF